MAQMGEDFRNRLRSAEEETKAANADPIGVWEGGTLGFIEDDVFVEDVDPDDPANDPSQEWTYVRDQAL